MSEFSTIDHQMMARALQLAKRGQYTTTPNPNVGCVLVSNTGQVIGEGWHQKAGTAHAEIHALNQARKNALSTQGATAYVTLEPCSHQGKTGPCAQALIHAGIKKVVAAMVDPNPLVSGKGLAMLEQAGIQTSSGLMAAQAQDINQGFFKRMSTGKPWITVKLAASLDGKTALQNGQSQWITSVQARQDVQRYRAKSCAILSGSGTVMADNPSLNVRYNELDLPSETIAEADLRQPLRIILDGRNQLMGSLRCLQPMTNPNAGEVLLVNSIHTNQSFAKHVSQWQAPVKGSKLDLEQVMYKLGELQLNQIWVEAGAKLAGALLENKLIDELILYQAPKLIGGDGQNLFATKSLETMSQIAQLYWTDIRQVGHDVRMTARFNHH